MISHSPRRLHVQFSSPSHPSGQIASTLSPKDVRPTSTPVITVAPQPTCSIRHVFSPHRTAPLDRLVPSERRRAAERHGAFVSAVAGQLRGRVRRCDTHIVRSARQLEHTAQTHRLLCTSRLVSSRTARIHRLFPRSRRRAGSSNRALVALAAVQLAGFSGLRDLIEVALIHARGALHRLYASLLSPRAYRTGRTPRTTRPTADTRGFAGPACRSGRAASSRSSLRPAAIRPQRRTAFRLRRSESENLPQKPSVALHVPSCWHWRLTDPVIPMGQDGLADEPIGVRGQVITSSRVSGQNDSTIHVKHEANEYRRCSALLPTAR